MHPEASVPNRGLRRAGRLSLLAVALLLLTTSGAGLAQGQMRKSLGPEPGRLAPALNDEESARWLSRT